MILRPPGSKLPATLFPYTTLFRSRGDGHRPGSPEGDPLLADPELDDLVGHGAAPVLGDADEPPDTRPDLLTAHQQHSVGHRAEVPGCHFAGHEILEIGRAHV